MKIFTLSMIVASLTLIGCGNSSSNDSTTNLTSSSNEVTTVKDAEKNVNALGAFQSVNLTILNKDTNNKVLNINKFTSQKLNKIQKTQTVACDGGGSITLDLSDDEKTLVYTFNECKNEATSIDGKMTLIQEDDNSFEMDYDALTFKDVRGTQYMDINMKISEEAKVLTMVLSGTVNQTTASGEVNDMKVTNYIIKVKETSDESWFTVDGGMEFKSKCLSGTYTFETVEKLVDARDGSDNLESGILKINGATYTFENPNVTIEAGSESETMLQSEFDKRIETSNSCAI